MGRHISMMGVGQMPNKYYTIYTQCELQRLLSQSRKQSIVVLGFGSNTIVDDQPFEGLLLINKMDGFVFDESEMLLRVNSGVSLMRIVREAVNRGFSGFESLGGIPATIGGAVATNAGAYGVSISDLLVDIDVMDMDGNIHRLHKDTFEWGYRWSSLRCEPYIVTHVTMRLKKRSTLNRYRELLQNKRLTQPWNVKSCGCFFKNTGDISSGALIDSAGLKGFDMLGFQVSSKHANFIVNKSARSKNDLDLFIQKIHQRVLDKHGVVLTPEVHLLKNTPKQGIINLENYASEIS